MTDGSVAVSLLRAGVSLVIVLGLLILFMRILASRTGARPSRPSAQVTVEVLARRQLGRGSSVQVVKVNEKILLLGVTDTDVRVLTELSAADVVKEDLSDAKSIPDFSEVLRRQGEVGKVIAALSERQKGRHRG
ncbi:flagellar biosynthetic protein FliO [Gephyromycinifex aptenodytis]|uniref:flagellar biosynthetic protein FliO n=1 Tax=Gephyromycinifex aptenodytis TaxID=2716227 RepID=UPI00144530BB|nr:flagellar biosynthetic protein FliO [Gephyromycinifex aptenodytis]